MPFTITLLIIISTKNGQKTMYFQKPGKKSEKPESNSENLEKIFKKPMATLVLIFGLVTQIVLK